MRDDTPDARASRDAAPPAGTPLGPKGREFRDAEALDPVAPPDPERAAETAPPPSGRGDAPWGEEGHAEVREDRGSADPLIVAQPRPFPGPASWPDSEPPPRLGLWLAILFGTGAVSVLMGSQESAVLILLAGLFVAAQATDLRPELAGLYRAVSWIVPIVGAMLFGVLAWVISRMEPSPVQMTMTAVAAAAALTAGVTVFRPIADALSLALFRGHEPSHTLRLAARLVLMGLLLALPGWYAFRGTFEELLASSASLFEQGLLGTGLMGYIVLAFASVGFLVRRDLPATLARLGLAAIRPRDYALVPLGVLLLLGLNVGLEAVQKIWFPQLWLADQRVSHLIAAQLGPGQILMLGLSAGIGEEITMRGALQPRLGVALTALLFAALHVQYSWFGMGVIFGFGLLLGWLRLRTSTTVVMAIHTLYDIIVVATMPKPV